MELRHLKYFVAVAEELHFSRAAERLDIATPTLSAQIRSLESILGVQLFVRRTRGVALTEAGERVLEEARATLRQAERTKLVGRHAGRGELGSIALAYIFGPFVGGIVAASIAEFRKSHPDVAFQLLKTETFPQLKALAEGTLDVGFMRIPGKYPTELDGFVVDQQELWLAVPELHPLASCKLIAPEQLVGETFVAHPIEFEIVSAVNVAPLVPAAASGARKVARVSDITSALILVASGAGVTVVPQSATQVGITGVTYRKIGGKPRYAEYVVAFRKGENSPAVRAFIAMLRDKYKVGKHAPVDDARQLARRELPVSGGG
ncbi:MAG TPA: LysR substrate-binding domain-containing protein [Xanthobacteraceae bacterium]|nr:LysR substrate-binding domain-containing protein [Xanthobacteraceae bacterium]